MTQGHRRNLSGEQTEHTTSKSRSIAEWTTLSISLAIVLGVVGLIVALSIADGSRPPTIAIEPRLDQVRQETSGYYLPVFVRNGGNRTVENLLVEVKLAAGTGEPQSAEFTIVFLAGGEEAQGTVVFTDDPAAGELTFRAVSFLEP